MKTITAGETINIKIEAKDDQSGISRVEVEANNLRDLPGSPSFEAIGSLEWPQDAESVNVSIEIPEYIPNSKWKIASITITNGTGRVIKYSPSKDFPPILFNVKAKEGADITPAELISVTLLD
ncbi:MAG: hypothetical protein AB1782_15865 [Cyanobacteriota bacterium]